MVRASDEADTAPESFQLTEDQLQKLIAEHPELAQKVADGQLNIELQQVALTSGLRIIFCYHFSVLFLLRVLLW